MKRTFRQPLAKIRDGFGGGRLMVSLPKMGLLKKNDLLLNCKRGRETSFKLWAGSRWATFVIQGSRSERLFS